MRLLSAALLVTGVTLLAGCERVGADGPPAGASTAPPSTAPTPAPSSATAGKPKIRFETLTQDFGAVPHGTVVRRVFRFRNAGDGPLEILQVKPSCGCTAADPTKRRLLPGEEAELEVAFDTGKKPAGRGKQRHVNVVAVRSNDLTEVTGEGAGLTRIVLEGEVLARYQLIPEAGAFIPAFPQGTPSPVTVTVEVVPAATPIAGEPPVPSLRLPSVMAPAGTTGVAAILEEPKYVEVAGLREVQRDGKGALEISLRPRPGVPVGVIDGIVRLSTGYALQPEVVVPVRGYVTPAVQAIPAKLLLPRDVGDQPRPLRIAGARPFRVLGTHVVAADGLPPSLRAEPVQNAPAGSPQVTVRGVVPSDGTSLAGDVYVVLDDPMHPVVRVPYLLRDLAGQGEEAKAAMAAGVRISPPELFLGDIEPERDIEASMVVLRVATAAPIDVRDVAVTPEGPLTARAEPAKPGEQTRILIRVHPTLSGPILGRVSLRPRPDGPLLSIGLSARVRDRVEAEPPALVLRGGAAEARVLLRRADRLPLEVAKVQDPSGALALEVAPEADGAVRLTARPSAAGKVASGHRGEVRVTCQVAGGVEIAIPVIGVGE